jgi:hypothetical protein
LWDIPYATLGIVVFPQQKKSLLEAKLTPFFSGINAFAFADFTP